MAWLDEEISAQFARWEERGRGWQVWPDPVEPEPPFVPFTGYVTNTGQFEDDGRRPNPLVAALTRFGLLTKAPAPPKPPEPEPEPEPRVLERADLVELQLSLPARFTGKPQDIAPLFTQLGLCREPVTFELLATSERITIQFVAHADDAPALRRRITGHFPDVVVSQTETLLADAWAASEDADADALVVEFGLAHEFARPLARPNVDPYIGLLAALGELAHGELGLYQVIFQPVENPWADHLLRAVSDVAGKPIFQNAPELTKLAQEKIAAPLFAVVVRIAIRAEQFDRMVDLARDMAGALRVFGRLDGNELIPLHNAAYPYEAHIDDVVLRQSHRSGMLLNAEELTGFVHLPAAEVRTPRLHRDSGKTRAAPKASTQEGLGLVLGQNTHAGRTLNVSLSSAERTRHVHLIGGTGTGKSTMLFNLIQQGLAKGEGLAVFDPHGDLIDRILGSIPEHRIEDVILFDPSDEQFSIGFNVLSAHSDLEKNLLASDLISVFQRLSTSWGDQMGSVLQNAILAFLESSRGGTLADLRRFLLETEYRNDFLQTVNDPEIVYYWRKAFPQLSGNKSIGSVLTRLETFLAPKPIRYLVSQPVNRLDFRAIMDTGKVFLARLPQGQIGKENAYLLGSLLMAKFQQTAMSRQAQAIGSRQPFWLYLDEFHNFITPTMVEILTGARKYNVGLVLAHQELRQLERDREVAGAVMSNCYTRVVFRVGDDDARKLAEGFASFEARDLQNLDNFHALARIERSDHDFNLAIPLPAEADPMQAADVRQRVITGSREKYGTSRADVEAMLAKGTETKAERPKPVKEPKPSVPAPEKKAVPSQLPPAVAQPAEPLPPSEVQKPLVTVPEVIKAPAVEVAVAAVTPRELGRGGEQHKSIQERIQTAARELGFMAEIERQLTSSSNEAADLVLRKGDLAIAVEISITTTVDHEFGNVKKCLAAGFARVAVVSPSASQLKAIEMAVKAGLGPEVAGQVNYHTPDELIAELRTLAIAPVEEASPATSKERTSRGFKVRRHGPELSAAERKSKEDLAVKMMAQAMKPEA